MKKLIDFLGIELIHYKDFSFEIFDILSLIIVYLIVRGMLYLSRISLNKLVSSGKIDVRNSNSINLLIKYFIYVIALVFCLEIIGVKITLLLAGSAALLVGLGLGLQQIFADVVSGLFLLIEGSVKIGDIIEVDGIVGKVIDLKLRSSEVLTRDGIAIIVPNHKFISENVVNWSHNAAQTRFDVKVGVSYQSDPEKVREILLKCALSHKDVIDNDPRFMPNIRLINFGDSSLDFQILFWSSNTFFIENTKSELRYAIVKAFKDENIEIPFPQRDLHIRSGLK